MKSLQLQSKCTLRGADGLALECAAGRTDHVHRGTRNGNGVANRGSRPGVHARSLHRAVGRSQSKHERRSHAGREGIRKAVEGSGGGGAGDKDQVIRIVESHGLGDILPSATEDFGPQLHAGVGELRDEDVGASQGCHAVEASGGSVPNHVRVVGGVDADRVG